MEQTQDKQIHLPSQPSITHIKALKYIRQHKKPLVKLELCKSKSVVPTNLDDETRNLHSAFEALKEALDYIRVDRRCNRCKAEYLHDQNLVCVTKIVGTISQYGFHNKNGKFLNAEEALFLLETNRIEIFWEEVPLSLQQAYTIMLKTFLDLCRYRVYQKFLLCGLKLSRSDFYDQEPECKRRKTEDSTDVMKNIGKDAPKLIFNDIRPRVDYEMVVNGLDLNLCISDYSEFDRILGYTERNGVPNLFAFVSPDSVACYMISSVCLPRL